MPQFHFQLQQRFPEDKYDAVARDQPVPGFGVSGFAKTWRTMRSELHWILWTGIRRGRSAMPYQRGQSWIRRFQRQATALCVALVALAALPPAPSNLRLIPVSSSETPPEAGELLATGDEVLSSNMSLGKRGSDEKQEPIWIEAAHLATPAGYPLL
jgi:hypothetical protein